jgi:hypothetical protein
MFYKITRQVFWNEIQLPKSSSSQLEGNINIVSYIAGTLIPWIGTHLRFLSVNGTENNFNDSHLARIVRFTPKLVFLDLTKSNVGKKGLEFLFSTKSCPNIETLILSNILVDDSILGLIGESLPNLLHIDLSVYAVESRFSDYGILKLVRGCPKIQKLILTGSRGLTDTGLGSVSEYLSDLRYLDITGAFLVTDEGIHFLLNGNTLLEILTVSYCWKLTNNSLSNISKKFIGCNLKELNMSFCYQLSNEIVDHMVQLPSLRIVNLSYCSEITMDAKFRLLERGIYVI